jgi:NAD(P)-dependent dehydrogenase (short-subunit alcohol dehydrogenase family)
MDAYEELASSTFTPAFIVEQNRDLPVLASVETCSGATYIVTGANVGLGFETTRHLVRLGATKVILAVRNIQAGEEAKAKIETETKKSNIMEVWVLDLANFDSVKAFAKRVTEEVKRIDAIVENAAVALGEWSTAEGHESTITVNVLGTLLLGVLLLPLLVESGRHFNITPRLVFTSSEASWTAQQQFAKIKASPLAKLDNERDSVQHMDQRYTTIYSSFSSVFTHQTARP